MTPLEKRLLQQLKEGRGGYEDVLALQEEERTMVSVIIDRPLIVLKPRPWSSEALEFDLGTIRVKNEFAPVKGRWCQAERA